MTAGALVETDARNKLIETLRTSWQQHERAIDRWRFEDSNPPQGIDLEAAGYLVQAAEAQVVPAKQGAVLSAIAEIVAIGRTFNVQMDVQKLSEVYLNAFLAAKITRTQLNTLVERAKSGWEWTFRMPFPNELLSLVAPDQGRCRTMLAKCQAIAQRLRADAVGAYSARLHHALTKAYIESGAPRNFDRETFIAKWKETNPFDPANPYGTPSKSAEKAL